MFSLKVETVALMTKHFILTFLVSHFFFQLEHKKEYNSEVEERFRFKIFMENKHKIAKHNQQYERGNVSYKLGVNKYADLLHHEFLKLNGFNKTVGLQ